jgi:sulfur-carrier protein adenylyltransferase/sulfurtransferase
MNESPVIRILNLARWTPSGDNTQPWRFEIIDDYRIVVHIQYAQEMVVYDLYGQNTLLAIGALLQTMELAATSEGFQMHAQRRQHAQGKLHAIDISFSLDQAIQVDSLVFEIPRRAVQRRPLSMRPLTHSQKQSLQQAAGKHYTIHWMESLLQRLQMTKLILQTTRIRLRIPEAYPVHKSIIEWNAQYSLDRIPDAALGPGRINLKIMRSVLSSWGRVQFLNHYIGAAWSTSLQLDGWTALSCGAHMIILRNQKPQTEDDFIDSGKASERVWLAATKLNLWQQPEMALPTFARYASENVPFTTLIDQRQEAAKVRLKLGDIVGTDTDRVVWVGRVGFGPAPVSRALRLPLEKLIISGDSRKQAIL